MRVAGSLTRLSHVPKPACTSALALYSGTFLPNPGAGDHGAAGLGRGQVTTGLLQLCVPPGPQTEQSGYSKSWQRPWWSPAQETTKRGCPPQPQLGLRKGVGLPGAQTLDSPPSKAQMLPALPSKWLPPGVSHAGDLPTC